MLRRKKRRERAASHDGDAITDDTSSVGSRFSVATWSAGGRSGGRSNKKSSRARSHSPTLIRDVNGHGDDLNTSHTTAASASSSSRSPRAAAKGGSRRRSVSLPRRLSNIGMRHGNKHSKGGNGGGNGSQREEEDMAQPLSAVTDIEKLASQNYSGSANADKNEKFKVYPDFAYPNTRMNRDELRTEMNLPSSYYHNLRQRSKTDDEIGLFYLEILQCFGLPRFDYFSLPSAFVVGVCGSHAFKTDVIPPLVNPMWLCKMRRACVFPVYWAYQTCHIGVFAKQPSENTEDSFVGRIGLKISQFRPHSTYDVTLPLRLSTQVYTRQQRGSIRVRFYLHYHNEKSAVWSYIPKNLVPKLQPNESIVVNCTDVKSFQNVARTVHGVDMQSKFSMRLVKAISREIQFQQIHILRYLQKRELYHLRTWKYPIISAYIFISWMHAAYTGSVRYIPGHFITYFLLHMWKNYGIYCLDGKYDNGFMAPTFEELFGAMISGESDKKRERRKLRQQAKAEKAEAQADSTTSTSSPTNMTRRMRRKGGGGGAVGDTTTSGKKRSSNNVVDKRWIEPIEMVRTNPELCKSALQHFQDLDKQGKEATLEDIAKDFRRRLPTDSRMYYLKVYQNTFVGSDAVTFFVREGYAPDRDKAVTLGRQLAKQFKLFQHIAKKEIDFEDDNMMYYRFLTLDNSDYYINTHKPLAKGLFRTLNFRSDPALSREHAHIEFPFATAMDHPRFKVKESLILRNKESKALFEKMNQGEEDLEAEDAFGVEKKRRKKRGGGGTPGGGGGGGGKGGRSNDMDDVDGDDDDTDSASDEDEEDGNGALFTKSEGFKARKLDPTVMIERRGSSESFDEVVDDDKEDLDPRYEKKVFNKPANQNLDFKGKGSGKSMEEVLVATRHRLHQYLGHVFNDRAYKLDLPKNMKLELARKNSTLGSANGPTNGYGYGSTSFEKKSSSDSDGRSGFFRAFGGGTARSSTNPNSKSGGPGGAGDGTGVKTAKEIQEEEEQLYLSNRKDEYHRLLSLGKYAHSSLIVSRITQFVQPMLEMAQIGIFINRTLYNILTWRDPILSYWIVVIGTVLVVCLHCFPWRILFGLAGIYLVGPQNLIIRIAKEKAGGYEEPNFDVVIKKKKIAKEEKVYPDEPLFSNMAPDNRIVRQELLDTSNIRPVAVPVGPLMYNRFYDWPPEPEYARVKIDHIPQNDPHVASYLESLEFDHKEEQQKSKGGITSSVLVKPVTRWMRARKMGKKAVKNVTEGVTKVQEAATNVKEAAVRRASMVTQPIQNKIQQEANKKRGDSSKKKKKKKK